MVHAKVEQKAAHCRHTASWVEVVVLSGRHHGGRITETGAGDARHQLVETDVSWQQKSCVPSGSRSMPPVDC